jgi:outer membrane protein TolC
MLNLVMGLPIEENTQLKEDLNDLAQAYVDPTALDTPFSMENNVDFKLVNNLNEQRFYELKLAKSRALPTLNAFANYGSAAFSNSFTFLDGDQQWFDSSILGFDLSIPIFSSFKRSAGTQRAKIALEKAKTQLTETQERIRLQLEKAKSDYLLAIEQYSTTQQNLNLAERIEQKNQIKYKEGIASSFELRQAQTQLYTAQQEYLQSMVDVINTKTELEVIANN